MKTKVMSHAKIPCVNLKKSLNDASDRNAKRPVIFANKQEIIPKPRHQKAAWSNSSLLVNLYKMSKNNPDASNAIGK